MTYFISEKEKDHIRSLAAQGRWDRVEVEMRAYRELARIYSEERERRYKLTWKYKFKAAWDWIIANGKRLEIRSIGKENFIEIDLQ